MRFPELQHRLPRSQPNRAVAPLCAGDGQLRRSLLRATIEHGLGPAAGSLVHLAMTHDADLPAELDAAQLAQLMDLIRRDTGASFIGYEGRGRLWFVLPEGDAHARLQRLALSVDALCAAAASRADATSALSPAIGYVSLKEAQPFAMRVSNARAALEEARLHGDLQPVQARTAPQRQRDRLQLRSAPLQVFVTLLLSFGLPFCCYATLHQAGFDITAAVYVAAVSGLLLTAALIWRECLHALRPTPAPDSPAAPYPRATAIIAAYLPNEAATIVETVRAFLSHEYPGGLEVVVAYNTPHPLPVEQALRHLARRDPRLRVLHVERSTSKAQNVNAALTSISGAFVGIFDADHHPDPGSFARAWRWLSCGWDVVQGHCVIRNGADTWLTRLVAVEFETIYAVAHPGRAKLHAFGIFGGSNGYWRTEVLRASRLRDSMLTEDIDASLRALLAGRTIAYDPQLISRELAPLTLGALWSQRMRWAQGWFQVSLRHLWPALRSPALSPRQKLGLIHLLAWRELHPWLSAQVITVLSFWLWSSGIERISLMIPIFVLTTLVTLSCGPGQALIGFVRGAPEIRRHWHWYLLYALSVAVFYSGLKDLISRVAMVKELAREHEWRVTPRASRPAPMRTGGPAEAGSLT